MERPRLDDFLVEWWLDSKLLFSCMKMSFFSCMKMSFFMHDYIFLKGVLTVCVPPSRVERLRLDAFLVEWWPDSGGVQL